MSITVEAVYENGVLRPVHPLPFQEHEKVQVTIESAAGPLLRAYGIMGWTGEAKTLERIALDPKFLPRGRSMTFADLAIGDSVFIDANVYIFFFGPHPTYGGACGQLLQRIENQDLHGFTATHIVSEVAHRLMIAEATAKAGWSPGKVRQRLKRHPAVFREMTQFRAAVDTILQSHVQVLTAPPSLIGTALAVSQQFGLLINDALTVTLMRSQGLARIASQDADFDRVPGFTRYEPA